MTSVFRAGDVVAHAPSGETWLLACDEIDGRVIAYGWPETLAAAADCTLVKAADDEERMRILREVAKPDEPYTISGMSYRRSVARTQLAAATRPV